MVVGRQDFGKQIGGEFGVAAASNQPGPLARDKRDVRSSNTVRVGRDLESGVLRKDRTRAMPPHEVTQIVGEVCGDSPVMGTGWLADDQSPPD